MFNNYKLVRMTLFAVLVGACHYASAENKVVVIPMGADGEPVAGLGYASAPPYTNFLDIAACGDGREILNQVTITVPKTKSGSHVVCRASGRTLHYQTGKWIVYSLATETGTAADVRTYTGVATSTSDYNNWVSFSMQKVYPMSADGETKSFYFKACRQDTNTTGRSYHDDFICEVFTTLY